MKSTVDIELVFSEEYTEPKITILTNQKTRHIQDIIHAIEQVGDREISTIPAFLSDGEGMVFVDQKDIVRIHTEGRYLLLKTEEDSYIIKNTLSAVESKLNPESFLRISQSEIVNIDKVREFDLSNSGTVCVIFGNGVRTYSSRSYVKPIKDILRNKSCFGAV
ncbi:LytTR family DNA-binding domain-containing protein [Lachnospiraceae bacterium C1.1]|nr:LytTR family DNA-binding domain-containing protein [Lachnospiraceae bacterium C1.1]